MKKQILLASCLFFTCALAETDHDAFIKRNIFSNILNSVTSAVSSLTASLAGYFHSPIPNTHTNDIAVIRYSATDELCDQERAFLSNRLPRVQKQLEKMLNKSLEGKRIPRIAFCFSGGGFRAMLLTLGFLSGAQKIGLVDATTYMAGLSGSTWTLAPWIASGNSLAVYQKELPTKISKGLQNITNPSDIKTIINLLMSKIANNQTLSSVDIYGALLANTLLTDLGANRFTTGLSDSHATVNSGAYPLPLYTCITTNVEPYEWLEFSPYEVGSSYLQCYIPTWAYGRKFKNSVSVNTAPEQSLGYCIGIFGSAYAVDAEDIIRLSTNSIMNCISTLPTCLQSTVQSALTSITDSSLDEVRLFPSTLCNFTYQYSTSPLCTAKDLTLVDAGLSFNLPFPPLMRSERNIDIIIVYDGSADIIGVPELVAAQQYMQRKGLPFPPIDVTQAATNVISVFKDDTNPQCPIVIYMPRIKNPAYSTTFDPETCVNTGYCDTFNFDYTPTNIAELSGLAEFAVVQNANTIRQVINDVIARA